MAGLLGALPGNGAGLTSFRAARGESVLAYAPLDLP
jgi:hypothetical protein